MSAVIREANERQREAANAGASAWVSANAGSGKTRVLTDRVADLLLDVADPSRILCLTYTKAAAAEMSTRLFDMLGEWSTLDDAALAKALAATGKTVDKARLPEARRLFAQALETPGGLKIETIHAFCQRVLQRFPVEADVPPDFSVLDDREAAGLADEAMRAILRGLGGAAPDDLAHAFDRILAAKGEFGFRTIIENGIDDRRALEAFLAAHAAPGALEATVRGRLGLAPGETAEIVRGRRHSNSARNDADLKRAAKALAEGSENDARRGLVIEAYIANPIDTAWAAYCAVFFTKEGDPIKKALATKAVRDGNPGIEQILLNEQERLLRVLDRERAAEVADLTLAALILMRAILSEYKRLKDAHRALDYDDLIAKTLALLNETSAAWVHYKLDGGIDHLLVDEAQDTSPEQWEIVGKLTEEFFALEAQSAPRSRTVFAVGDEKQSIYSFQGADPARFAEMRTEFEALARRAKRDWMTCALEVSFRSAPEILKAVDATFANGPAREALTAAAEEVRHKAAREDVQGLVELWPAAQRQNVEIGQHENWMLPVDATPPESPEVKLADRIAKLIRHWIEAKAPLTPGGRAIGCGDVLILVRRRSALFYETIRALNREHLAVAGADRMVLRDEPAFLDLDALGRFCAMPQDDLALAEVLKGPFGETGNRPPALTDDDLLKLAPERKGSLWRVLRETPAYAAQRAWLEKRIADARELRPFEFFARALDGPEGKRLAMLERLGADAGDAIEEFLALALAYEREEAVSLQGFLAFAAARGDEIKRDMDEAAGRIRVMTVHGAKGLEAPIVFLIDTCSEPQMSRDLWMFDEDEAPPLPLIRLAAKEQDGASESVAAAEKYRQDKEYLRQLYVGMTRAMDRLYIAGVAGKNDMKGGELKPGCWHARIDAALRALGAATVATDDGDVLRYGTEPTGVGESDERSAHRSVLPAWARTPPRAELSPLRRTPSGLLASEESKLPASVPGGSAEAILRGRLIHKLLEELPKLAASAREAAAHRLMALARYRDLGKSADDIIAETMAVLTAPDFADVFGPESRAEVAIAGAFTAPSGRRILVSGQIDRLLVSGSRILILDYKTNRELPQPIPPAYLAQMAAYRRLLAEIFPGRAIETALLFTSVPRLVALKASDLELTLFTDEPAPAVS